MADKKLDYHAPCANDEKDEIEGLNEKLLQLLSAQKLSSPATNQLSHNSQLEDRSYKLESNASVSSLSSTHCRYDCSIVYHDNPIRISAAQTYLPPIGVFWDIENCQVSVLIFCFV